MTKRMGIYQSHLPESLSPANVSLSSSRVSLLTSQLNGGIFARSLYKSLSVYFMN